MKSVLKILLVLQSLQSEPVAYIASNGQNEPLMACMHLCVLQNWDLDYNTSNEGEVCGLGQLSLKDW